ETPGATGRRKLLRTTVKAISKSVQPVVRVSLDSGEEVRCTADHRWYAKRYHRTRPGYFEAVPGRWLQRICPPSLPEIGDDAINDAGWLGGFFDGDGSVSGDQITLTQGDGRNRPLCEKLEAIFNRFGFDWGRSSKITAEDHVVRTYYLRLGGLPGYQRFLHIAQPEK